MQETNTYAFFEKKNRAGILPCHKSTAWDNGKFDFVKQILTQIVEDTESDPHNFAKLVSQVFIKIRRGHASGYYATRSVA
jgi:hypothetical protein